MPGAERHRAKAGADWADWAFLALLSAIAVLGFLGQSLPAILLQPIKLDLDLSDVEIGLFNGLAVTLAGALAAFPIGLAADRFGRSLVLAASVLVWSVFVVVLGMAQGVAGYGAGLIGFNLGDAAMLPLIYAMVAARFDNSRRELANGILVAVILLSSSGIFAVGGLLLQAFEANPVGELAPWRAVCLCVAVLGPLAALPLLIARRPERGAEPELPSTEAATSASYADFLKQNGLFVAALMVAVSVFYIAYSVFMFWLPAILERAFGMAVAEANLAIGRVMFAGTLAAIFATLAFLKPIRRRWGHGAPLYLVIIGCILVLLPACALFFASSGDTFLLLVGLLSFGMGVSMMLVPGLLQSCAPDRFRSRTIALFPIMSAAMRIALPALIGALSTQYGEDGRTLLTIVTWVLVACFAFSIAALSLIAPSFAEFARRNLAGDSRMPEALPC